jgi:hypothetical protein
MKNVYTAKQQAREDYSATVNIGVHENDCRAFLQFNQGFQQLLLEAIDEALSQLGNKAREAVYFYLKETFNINRQHIPFKITKFSKAIEEILGPGAKLLEIEIMKHLYEKMGDNFRYSPAHENLAFTEYITAARNFLYEG